MDTHPIPRTMRALQLASFDGVGALQLVEKPVPQSKAGEVLVRVLASPVNPSDVMFCRGLYTAVRSLPTTPGFEGYGLVVAHGRGWLGRRLMGKRVACGARGEDGMWAEYAAVPAMACLPLPNCLSDEQGASAIVNPTTAWAMFHECRRGGHRALIQTAAASQVGRMVLRLGRKHSLPVMHVVHRAERVELLKNLGAEHVLNSSDEGFEPQLRKWAHDFHATYAIDAVGGETTRQLLSAMPGGTVVVYGALAEEPCVADPRDLIFGEKRVEGFWLSSWIARQKPLRLLWKMRRVRAMLDQELKTDVAVRLTLEAAASDLAQYLAHASKGKILLLPREHGIERPHDVAELSARA